MGWLLLSLLAAALIAASLRPAPRAGRTNPERSRPGAEQPERSMPGAEQPRDAKPGAAEPGVVRRDKDRRDDPDPFEVLRIQLRLGALAEEVRKLERSDGYGRMHHWTATQAAYDALLGEACLLAGISMTLAPEARRTVPHDEQERFREEVELASRGWSW